MMLIPEWSLVALSVSAGVIAGAVFFGGLWWTVRRVAHVQRVALFLGASFALRAAVMLLALYFSCDNDIIRMAGFLVGFFVVRVIAVRRKGSVK
ncbi:MAG: ATP synthase subunit I [Bacillota bacterium]